MSDWSYMNERVDEQDMGPPAFDDHHKLRREMEWMVPPAAVATLLLWHGVCALCRLTASGVRSLVSSVGRRVKGASVTAHVPTDAAGVPRRLPSPGRAMRT